MKYIIILGLLILISCGGNPGKDGSSCHVTELDNGALISCDDGSEVQILNGPKGVKGEPGQTIVIICKKGEHGPKTCQIQK